MCHTTYDDFTKSGALAVQFIDIQGCDFFVLWKNTSECLNTFYEREIWAFQPTAAGKNTERLSSQLMHCSENVDHAVPFVIYGAVI
jgi:hypothetical protein